MQWDLKRSHFAHTFASRLHSDRRVMPDLSESRVFRPICPRGAALALDAAFNLWICGNREDFLSTDPLAPSVHNPAPFSHTALLTRIEESQYTAAVSVGARTHTHMVSPPLTHILLPQAFCFTAHILHHCYYNQCT